jgi:fimbrial chaperone protein
MRSWISGILAATALIAAPVATLASTLEVTPINVEIPAPGAVSAVTLNNPGADLVNAQVRIFKWTQQDGQDQLAPTTEVVASPPAIKLDAGKKGVIRVVRLNKQPIAAEETYRLIVDEVPKPIKPGQVGVGFSVRYSIPVFFSKPGETPTLIWKASVGARGFVLEADNSGGRRARLAALKIVAASGKSVTIGNGLAGYVLSQSARTWLVKGAGKNFAAGGTIKIIAQGDNGPIEATAKVVAAN